MSPERNSKNFGSPALTRRGVMRSTARLAALGAAAMAAGCGADRSDAGSAEPGRVVKNGRIRQSVALWCYTTAPWNWDLEKTCRVARKLGCESVELAEPDQWPVIRKHGLKQCAGFGVPNVIAFTGFKWRDAEDPASGEIPLAEGAGHTVKALKELARHAEQHNVTICLEMLNTRDDSDPMKGHPGYQGDDLDYCAEIVRRVGSPNVKLLFDVYHVQVMNGDLIRRIRQYAGLIGHVHAAGNPGRGELDENQEINYRGVMQALLAVGYTGYVGQEFIPTRDPEQSLAEAVAVCDV